MTAQFICECDTNNKQNLTLVYLLKSALLIKMLKLVFQINRTSNNYLCGNMPTILIKI